MGKSTTPEYYSWNGMRRRCICPECPQYPRYGGRGIRVCDSWLESFESFLADVGKRPFPDAQLDRIDNDGHYEPGNVRWVSAAENARNRNNNTTSDAQVRVWYRLVCSLGWTQTECADFFGVSIKMVSRCLKGERRSGVLSDKEVQEVTDQAKYHMSLSRKKQVETFRKRRIHAT